MNRFGLATAVLVIFISGCVHDAIEMSSVGNSSSLAWFQRVNSAENREAELHRVFASWGTGDSIHDQRVVDVLCHCYGGHKHAGFYTDETLRGIILDRLKQDPQLIRSVWLRERNYIPDHKDLVSVAQFTSEVFRAQRPESEKFYFLILIASMLDRPEIVTAMDPTNIDDTWNDTHRWLEENANRYQYDRKKREYVLRQETSQRL